MNQDVVNPRMVDTVDSEFEEFLHIYYDNTFNPATPSERITYFGNLKKNKPPGFGCRAAIILIYISLIFIFFQNSLINTMLNLSMFNHC